jgi:hypothetical protein
VNTNRDDPSPTDFYAAFLKVVGTKQAALQESWLANRAHTSVMCKETVGDIAQELGMRHHIEYYGIDAILYHERDQTNFPDPRSNYAKYVSVALEHENEYTGAAVEMNKLQLWNVPLTVLITYPPTERTCKKTLEKYATIIQDADIFDNASTQRRQLSIFGYPGPDWDAFVYQDGRFVPLAAERSTSV